MWEWIVGKASQFGHSIKDYLYDITIGEMKIEMKMQLSAYVNDMKYIFLIAAIVGLYCTMAGEKKIGTKITSLSIFGYIIARSVMAAYGF